MFKKIKVAYPTLVYLAPLAVFAQSTVTNVQGVLGVFGNIANLLVPLIVVLALIYFFWGLAKYILAAGDEETKNQGRSIMIWGIVALFVMASVWGLVAVLQNTFDVGEGNAPTIPIPTIP